MAPSSSKPSGYTLLEILIVLTVMGIIGLTASAVLVGQRRFLSTETYHAQNQADTAVAAETIGEIFKRSDAVIASHDFTINGSTVTVVSGDHALVVAMPGLDASSNPLAAQKDYIAILFDPSNAARVIQATDADAASTRKDGQRQLLGKASVMNFTYNAPTTIDSNAITVTVRSRSDFTFTNTPLTTAEVSARLRNA